MVEQYHNIFTAYRTLQNMQCNETKHWKDLKRLLIAKQSNSFWCKVVVCDGRVKKVCDKFQSVVLVTKKSAKQNIFHYLKFWLFGYKKKSKNKKVLPLFFLPSHEEQEIPNGMRRE